MTSYSFLIIFGTCMTLSALVSSDPVPNRVFENELEECQYKSHDAMRTFELCIKGQFSEAEMNETRRIYNETTCLDCKNFCRKQEAILNCLRELAASLKDLSISSRNTVPFVEQVVTAGFTAFCENSEEMFSVYNDGNETQCYQEGRSHCQQHVEFMGVFDRNGYCDFGGEYIPVTTDFVRRNLMDLLDCMEKHVDSCSGSIKNFFTNMISNIRNAEKKE